MKNKQTIYLSSALEEDTEFIPLMTNEEEEQMNAEQMPAELPILPLRNTVLFPGVVIPITVGRDKSIKLLRDAHTGNKTIGVVSQKDDKVEDPSFEELNTIGTVAHILRIFRMPDGNTTVIIQGKRRFQLVKIIQKDPYLKAEIIPIAQPALPTTKEFEAIVSSIKDMALQIIQLSPHIPSEANIAIKNIESPVFLINFIASNMNAEVSFKQQLLEVSDVLQKANMLISHMSKELQMLQLKSDIQSRVRTDIDKQQREYFLHQQMRMIQEELGGSPQEIEIKEFKEKAEKKKWPAEAKKTLRKRN